MSSIHKLSIRGIRSFSHEREQAIEFYAPLTMIVGANGCGKTTIIECLKYACTGSLPPNSGKGQFFVHDPKVSGTSEVKANIKLRFSGRDAKVSVVIRSFQLTQKRVTLQFKALDGVIRTKDENGMSVNITHKCTELESHIPFRLGVSKAILEHVVFCHQEDSSWPLQDPKSVKTKFDDIFESARYTKALDEIKSTRKEYDKTAKNLQVELAGLHERLRAAEGLKSELQASRAQYDQIRSQVEEIDGRNKELNDTLAELNQVAEEVELLEAKKESLERARRDLDVRIGEKRENIGDALSNDSDQVLEEKLREFDQNYQKLANEIRMYRDQADECSRRANEAKRRKEALGREEGRLQAQLQHQDKVVAARDRLMERLAQRYHIFDIAPSAGGSAGDPGSVGRYTPRDVKSFEASLKKAVDKANAALSEARSKSRIEIDAMGAELNKLKLEQRRSEDAVGSKTVELRKIQNEIASLSRMAGGSGASAPSQLGVTVSRLERELKQAETTAESAQRAFDDFKASNKIGKLTGEAHNLEAQIATLKTNSAAAHDLVQELSHQQELQHSRKSLVSQIDDEEGALKSMCEESSAVNSNLQWMWKEFTADEISRAREDIRTKRAEKEEERAEKERGLIDLRRDQAEKEIILRQKASELTTVTKRLSLLSASALEAVRSITDRIAKKDFDVEEAPGKLEQSIANESSDTPTLDPTKDLDEAVEYLRRKEAVAKETLYDVGARRRFIKKTLKGAKRPPARQESSTSQASKYWCPTCFRDMTNEEHESFEQNQTESLQNLMAPSFTAKAEARIADIRGAIKCLEGNAKGWREWKQLSSQPAALEETKARVDGELSQLLERVEVEKQEAKQLLGEREDLDAALSETNRLLDRANRIIGFRIDLQSVEAKLQRFGEGRTLADAQNLVKENREKLDKANSDLQEKNQELLRAKNKQLQLTNALNASTGDLNEAINNLATKKEFDMKREALKERERSVEAELMEAKAKEQPLRQQAREKESQLTRLRDQIRSTMDQLQVAAQNCGTDQRTFIGAQRDVEAGLVKNLPEALADVGRKLKQTEEDIDEMEREVESNKMNMNGKVLESNKQGQAKKVLKDNVDYRGHMREMEEKKSQMTEVDAEIARVDSKDVRGQMSRINKEVNRNTQGRAELKGRLHGLKDQVRGFETKLQTDAYNHIEEKHRRKMIEHRTTEMAVSDLDKYWTALDKALLRFHTMKIADINKIIRELWAMTYSGEDIDMIEIVSGDEGEEANKAKRSYNYRVVMRKNDATLDMKGRCSAGQRVLASIVIRLALAETFSVSCGILALDEPTTNLDRENKIGLARALSKIISNRSKQSNFQLITITHDEEFVQTMRMELSTQAGISMPEYGYRISREEMARGKFYSRIDRHHWEDM